MTAKNRKISVRERQARIGEMLQKEQEVSIPALAELFGVSEMTIRRDFDKFEAAGQIKRTHGGAIPAERMIFEFDFVTRRQSNQRAKRAIAKQAAKLIQPGNRVVIDTGTTTLELAHLLRDLSGLTVITPSLAVASELQFSEGIQTVLLGGLIRKGSPDLTGMVTETVLDMFAADIAFQGADGIGLDGSLYNSDMLVSKVDQKIRSRAERTYVLADSSKIGKTALACHGSLLQVEALITDDGILPQHRQQFEQLGIHVVIVKK